MPDDREYELKFLVEPKDMSGLAVHPALAEAMRGATASLRATYFDTPDRKLRDGGFALRIRDTDGHRVQTLKQLASSFVDRGEWEHPLADGGGVPDLKSLRDTPFGEAFGKHELDDLARAMITSVERRTATIERDGASIEIAIDQGEIEAGSRRLPINEVELELKSGPAEALFGLARDLVDALPLTPSLISKAERGFRLLDGSWGQAFKSSSAPIEAGMTTAQAFQATAESCLHDLMLNMTVFGQGNDVEAVHKTRVAVRRLRAAMTLFRPRLEDAALAELRDELSWLSDLLGAARDLDVFQTEMFDPAAADPQLLGGAELSAHMQERRTEAHRRLAEALGSKRLRLLTNNLLAWILSGDWIATSAPDPEDALLPFATKRLKSRRKHILEMGASLFDLLPDQRHKLRIEAKKLRYELEFFKNLPQLGKGSKPYAALLVGLETIQASLGHLHDHEAKQDLLRQEVMQWRTPAAMPDLRAVFAAGQLASTAPSMDALMDETESALRQVRKNNPF